jgi:hypothetical protein
MVSWAGDRIERGNKKRAWLEVYVPDVLLVLWFPSSSEATAPIPAA